MAGLQGFLIVLFSVAAYFAPTIVAGSRRPPHIGSVIVVNVFLGWTIVGWVVALAMACRSKAPSAVVVVPQVPQQ
jgi:hypothetical protein